MQDFVPYFSLLQVRPTNHQVGCPQLLWHHSHIHDFVEIFKSNSNSKGTCAILWDYLWITRTHATYRKEWIRKYFLGHSLTWWSVEGYKFDIPAMSHPHRTQPQPPLRRAYRMCLRHQKSIPHQNIKITPRRVLRRQPRHVQPRPAPMTRRPSRRKAGAPHVGSGSG